jgi:hypothetical protein
MEKMLLVSYCEMKGEWEKRGIHTCSTVDKRSGIVRCIWEFGK